MAAAGEAECKAQEARGDRQFGSKSIGYLAGCALLVNNITGPGVPQLPNMFAEAGWLLPTICIIAVWLMTTLSSSMYCEAMRRIPGNEHFQGRAEYVIVAQHYFGPRAVALARVGLNGALQSLNIISVVLSAQVVDAAISAMFGKSCAVNLTPFANVFTSQSGEATFIPGSTDILSCIDVNDLEGGNAWGCHIVLSLGYVLAAAMAVPCGYWDLEENMTIQTVAFVLTICCWLVWIAASMTQLASPDGPAAPLPAVNWDADTGSQAAVVGTILFNFGFVTTVPSWVNEKRPHVSVNRSLWGSTTICIAVFFLVGLLGASAFPDVLQGLSTNTCAEQVRTGAFNCANNLLQVFTKRSMMPELWRESAGASFLLQLSVYLFPVVAVVSSIPVFSIVVKYNLVEAGSSRRVATWMAVILPWVIAFPLLQMPNALGQLVNFTSLIFVTFTDFLVPLLLYVKMSRQQERWVGPAQDGQQGGTEVAAAAAAASASGDAAAPGLAAAPAAPAGAADCVDLETAAVAAAKFDASAEHPVHSAFPLWCNPTLKFRVGLALVIAMVLTVSAVMAMVLSVMEGLSSYGFTQQTCALVGS